MLEMLVPHPGVGVLSQINTGFLVVGLGANLVAFVSGTVGAGAALLRRATQWGCLLFVGVVVLIGRCVGSLGFDLVLVVGFE